MTTRYFPEFFDAPDLASAMSIILTDEDTSTAERWEKETAWIVGLLCDRWDLNEDHLVIDYGCGVGRIARALIVRCGCAVVGVDISASMRALAASYVNDDRFMACSPAMLPDLGMEASCALSTWVLQHAIRPKNDIVVLHSAMAEGAPLFVLNSHNRLIPTSDGLFTADDQSVPGLLGQFFDPDEEPAVMPPDVTSKSIREDSWWRFYRRR
jgi:SAM-dependent methyltransferase